MVVFAETGRTQFDPSQYSELTHAGALDARVVEFSGDSFPDIVTFFAPGGWGIKFWKNVPSSSGGRTFVDDTVNRIAATTALWTAVSGGVPTGQPKFDVFGDIYDLEFVDTDWPADGRPNLIVAGRQPWQDKIYDLTHVAGSGFYISGQRAFCASLPQTSDYYHDPNNPTVLNAYRWTTGVAVGDIDLDNRPDVVLAYRCSKPRVFLYDPATNDFVQNQILPHNPAEDSWLDPLNGQPWAYKGNGWRGVTLGDLTGDGKLDVVAWRTTKVSYATLLLATRNEREVETHPLISAVHVWERQPSNSYAFSYVLKPRTGVDTPQSSSPSLQCYLKDIGPDDLAPGTSRPDLIVPVVGGPTRDYRPRIYRNRTSFGAGKLGEVDPVTFFPLYLPLDSALYGTTWPEFSAHGAWADADDINGDGFMDIAVPHHTDNRQPTQSFPNGFINHNRPANLTQYEDDPVGDRIFLGSTSPAWSWSQMVLSSSNDEDTPFPMEIRPKDYGQGGGIPVPFRNDDTRYMRFEDLDLDGHPDLIETNFFEQSGVLPAYSPRVFWNLL